KINIRLERLLWLRRADICNIKLDGGAGGCLSPQDFASYRVFYTALDHAPHRPRAQPRVVAFLDERAGSLGRQTHCDLLGLECAIDLGHQQPDYLGELGFIEGAEEHDFVEAIEELRLK